MSRDYAPYGQQLTKSGTGRSGYGFTGEQFAYYTQFVYLRARWMDPVTGRFISQDPWAGSIQQPSSLHKYAYVSNNPIANVDHSGLGGPEWWEKMLEDPTWRQVLFDSAARHNTTAMPDLEFVALMAAIIRTESGAISGRPVTYEDAALTKALEIWYNNTPFAGTLEGTWFDDSFHLGQQTEGISNISLETIANLRRGWVPRPNNNFRQTDIQIYDYSEQSLPGLFPFPGLTSEQQSLAFRKFVMRTSLIYSFLYIPFECIDISRNLQLIRQDQNIEYLAANLEAGTIRAGWEGVEPTAEVLSWWHHQGIVVMWQEDELAKSSDRKWVEDVTIVQGKAQAFWSIASPFVQEAIQILDR